MSIANTPQTPYFAVIFTSFRTEGDNDYSEVAEQMVEMAKQQRGFLGIESARNEIGITVSYWKTEEDIRNWKAVTDHKMAQKYGREKWYSAYKVRVCKVERDYGFTI